MKTINFLFGIHNHQPVGNFDHVFEESFERCYIPFLEVLKDHPGIRISLHTSGPLWDWALEKNKKYIDLIGSLVDNNQIELLSGGYYEPLLSIIPENDVIGQIEMMNGFIKKTFGQEPKGFWLTERVWEPHLPSVLKRTKMKYTITDDSHFRLSGNTDKHITDYYITEKYGNPLLIFPISKPLRYFIPFKLPEETIKLLRELANEENVSITYADDGEKFGIWPHTYKWVFEEKYLHNLFGEIEKNSDWIKMPTFGELIESEEPKGKIYLPTASYEEMMEWALPAEAINRSKKASAEIESQGKKDEYGAFFRGGIWSNFFAKYPESNHMYRRMIYVSFRLNRLIEEGGNDECLGEALRCLYKAQCNCAYWHGLFGGIYLNYLRHAIYSNLIESHNNMDKVVHSGHKNWCNIERERLFDKKEEEIIVESRHSNIILSPSQGASLIEYDYKPKNFNISNVVSRHEESYHSEIRKAQNSSNRQSDTPKSIHDVHKVKNPETLDKILFDKYERYSFIEHLMPIETGLETFRRNSQQELKDPLAPYSIESLSFQDGKRNYLAKFKRDLLLRDSDHKIGILKSYSIKHNKPEFDVAYTITNKSKEPIEYIFAVELNLTLLAGDDPKRYFTFGEKESENRVKLSSLNEYTDIKSISLTDEWFKFRINLKSKEDATIWTLPLETVSQSESGFELTYQGSTIVFLYPLKLKESSECTEQISFIINEL